MHGLGGEAAEHHAVGGADAGTGLHGNNALDGHRHVDDDAITLLDAFGLERVGELADALQHFLVGDLGDLAVVGFKDDGGLVLDRRAHVLVQAVGGGIQLAIFEPFVERRIGFVQHFGEGLGPHHVLTGQTGPETFIVFFCFVAECLIGFHALDARTFHGGFGRGKYAVFDQYGLNRTRLRCHRCLLALGGCVQFRAGCVPHHRRMCMLALTFLLLSA